MQTEVNGTLRLKAHHLEFYRGAVLRLNLRRNQRRSKCIFRKGFPIC